MVKVVLDSWLKEFGSPEETTIPAADVGKLLDVLEERYPGLRYRLRDETGAVRRYVRVFVDGEALDPHQVLKVPLRDSQTVDILHSIAGG